MPRASAQDQPDVLSQAVANYRAARTGGDRDARVDAAYDLWRTAEDVLGDHAQTGVYAHIYAVQAQRLPVTERTEKRIGKAFKRAVELAPLSADSPIETSLKRRLNWLEHNARRLFDRRNDRLIAETNDMIERYGFRDTRYDADFHAVSGRLTLFERRGADEAIRILAQAIDLYDMLDEPASRRSMMAYESYLKSLATAGEPMIAQAMAAQRYADAAISGKADARNQSEAIRYYSNALSVLIEADALDAAMADGFTVRPIGDLMERADLDVIKVPPMVPARSTRSGKAELRITVDDEGRVDQVTIISATTPEHGEAAAAAVRMWLYNPYRLKSSGYTFEETIVFDLYGDRGQKL